LAFEDRFFFEIAAQARTVRDVAMPRPIAHVE
jgi:hypothetical protein